MARGNGDKRARTRKSGLKRKVVVKDEKLLSPVYADFSTIVLGQDVVIQNLFQTVIPVEDLPESGELEAALVARFIYGPDFFKALMSLFVRQYVAFESFRGKKDEAISWLKQLLQKVESGNSTESREPTTLP